MKQVNTILGWAGNIKNRFKGCGKNIPACDDTAVITDDSFKPDAGKNAVYTESGWKAEVEILENNSDSEKYSYTLKVIKTYADGKFGRLPNGHIFTAFANKQHMIYCDWEIETA